MAGKTGADAIGTALHHICRIVVKYQAKLSQVIDDAVTAGAITSSQGAAAHAFVAAANTTCLIFEAIAAFNSISP
jgi:hypothetical protein